MSRIIAFVHIQKTAGTSLKFVIRNSLGVRHSDVNPVDPREKTFRSGDLAFARSANPHLESISGHELCEPTRHLDGEVAPYTMLREPIARMLSHFQHKVATGRHPNDFPRFLEDPENHNFQVRKIAGGEDLTKAIRLLEEAYFFVGLAERFDASLMVLQALCPFALDTRYRQRNVATDNRLRRRVEADPGLMAAAETANRLDRQLWEYVDEALFPGLLAQSGADASRPVHAWPRGRPPWRYHTSRLYHRAVYRTRLKRERRRRGFA
jgi:hypothetical protein